VQKKRSVLRGLSNKVNLRFAGAVVWAAAAACAWALPQNLPPAPAGPQSVAPEAPAGSEAARRLFDLLNGERMDAGLAPLAWDERLAAAAQAHAQLMAGQNRMAHQFPGEPPLAQRLAGVPLNHSGENIAVGASASEVHEGLMASAPHRANILFAEYNAAGIGVVRGRAGLCVAEDFAERIPEISNEAATAEVAGASGQARKNAGLPPLKLSDDSRVQNLACKMAHEGKLNTELALRLPDAISSVAYTSMDPNKLPRDMLRLLDTRGARNYAIGVCFARAGNYLSGTYWVLVVLFAP
jgi:uncharacterized protein YkwD